MAYWVVKINRFNNSKYFQCDFISDINKLPTTLSEGEKQIGDTTSSYRCAPGSQCFCHEDGSTWLLGKEINQWTQQKSGAGGTGGISYLTNEPDNLTEGMTWISD